MKKTGKKIHFDSERYISIKYHYQKIKLEYT